ncbi:hypothetical protein [Dialister micraerophilus]|uniref:hypothetical protein n=1 Tax=Dialister micraerophilus TaxID=309120 RepID=UPI0023F4EBDA|nr:hypothetical protein [Dialister micraerophilus]
MKKYKIDEIIYSLEELLVRLVGSNINMLIGTDAPNPTITPGFSLHKEMQLWNKAGVSEIDILKTATGKILLL